MITAIPMVPLGPAACASVAFEQRGALSLTLVVKATFAMIADGPLEPVAPEPIEADDLAAFKPRADVVLIGPREAPAGADKQAEARLVVSRGGVTLIDRTVRGDHRAIFADLGAIPREGPERTRLLGGADPAKLAAPVALVPDVFEWSYFQDAHVVQRVDALRGDEVITLHGLHPLDARFETRLPELSAFARLHGLPRAAGPREVALALDTLRLDPAQQLVHATFRGCVELTGQAPGAFAGLSAIVAVQSADRAPTWPASLDELAASRWPRGGAARADAAADRPRGGAGDAPLAAGSAGMPASHGAATSLAPAGTPAVTPSSGSQTRPAAPKQDARQEAFRKLPKRKS